MSKSMRERLCFRLCRLDCGNRVETKAADDECPIWGGCPSWRDYGCQVDAIRAELDSAGYAVVLKADLILSPETIRILGALASGGRPAEKRVTTSATAILAAQKRFHETVLGPRPGHE